MKQKVHRRGVNIICRGKYKFTSNYDNGTMEKLSEQFSFNVINWLIDTKMFFTRVPTILCLLMLR